MSASSDNIDHTSILRRPKETVETRLQGLPLHAARTAWIFLALLSLAVMVASAVELFRLPIQGCDLGFCDNFEPTTADVQVLLSLDFPDGTFRVVSVASILVEVTIVLVAGVVFWRASRNWMALLTSATLLVIGSFFVNSGVDALRRAQPWLVNPYESAVTFVIGIFVILLYVFPDGRLVPHRPRLLGGIWIAAFTVSFGVVYLDLTTSLIENLAAAALVSLMVGGLASQTFRYFRVSGPTQRQQAKWVLLGMAGVGALTLAWPSIPIFLPHEQPGLERSLFLLIGVSILLLSTLLFPVGVAFSILKYRLWDIDMFINRAVVYGALTAALVGGYFALAFSLSQAAIALFGPTVSESRAVAVLAAFSVAAVAQPVRIRLQKLIDRLIYRRRIIRARFLEEATELLSRAQPPREVFALLENRASEILELEGAWLAAPHDLAFGDVGKHDRSLPDTPDSLLKHSGIERADAIVIASRADGDLDSLGHLWPAEELASWFAAGARVVVPLRRYGPSGMDQEDAAADVRAAWVLGRRKDGGLFDREDLDLFIRVGRQAAVVLDYARLHHEFDRAQLLKRYLSPQVAESILAGDTEVDLVSSRKILTVLFSDIRGFTAMSERMEPEELVDLLNEYLTAMTEIVFQHGGTLDKYIGDAVMVFVGDPIAYEDHEARALKIGFEMRSRLDRLQRGWLAAGDGELTIGIGIATGYVTVGNIGSPARTDYTVLGNHVNLASRLANRADGGQILITERTLQAVDDLIEAAKIDEMELRGVSRPIKIFDAGKSIAQRSQLRRAARRG